MSFLQLQACPVMKGGYFRISLFLKMTMVRPLLYYEPNDVILCQVTLINLFGFAEQGLGNERGDELCSGKVKDQNDVHKLSNETSVVENTSDETENNSNGIEIYRMEETKCILNQSSAFQEPVCAESADQAEESMNQENQSVSSFDCSPSKFRNHANTDDSGIGEFFFVLSYTVE